MVCIAIAGGRNMIARWIGILFLGLLSTTVGAATKEQANRSSELLLKEAREKVLAGDKEKAAALYYQLLKAEKTNQTARYELANLLVASELAEPYEEEFDILAFLRGVIKNSPITEPFSLAFLDNAGLNICDPNMVRRVLLSLQKLENHDNEAAFKIAETLQKKYPNHPVPYNLLGLAWQEKGDLKKAQQCFQKALAFKGDFQAARINLAEVELKLGKFALAHQALDKILKNDKRNRRASLVKAELYKLEGKPELARAWYTKVSEGL